jgi:hypothetical protein
VAVIRRPPERLEEIRQLARARRLELQRRLNIRRPRAERLADRLRREGIDAP